MATKTATIRVSREAHDLLAAQARQRGISLSALLAELAHGAEWEAIFRAEGDAARADAGDPAASVEEHEWETTLGDGVD